MRIGFFTETFYPQSNGVVTSIESFGGELVRRGHRVHVFCPFQGDGERLGMKVHGFPSVTFKPYPEFKVALPVLKRIPELDIVHTHGPFTMGSLGLAVAKKRKIHAISTFHTLLPEYVDYVTKIDYLKGVLEKVMWSYLKRHYRWYDLVISPSNAIKRILEEKTGLERIEVLPTGVDVKKLKPTPRKKAREKLGIPEEENVLLFLGRLSYEKSIDDVIRAVRGHESITLYIAGRGPAEPDLKTLARKLRVKNVKFLGFVPEEEKALYYSAADAFVMPSRTDTQGLVVLEAMACGCPVIAADALALPEFVDHGKNGYLYDPEKPEEIASLFLENITMLRRMRKTARMTAEEYSVEAQTSKLEKVYEEVLASPVRIRGGR